MTDETSRELDRGIREIFEESRLELGSHLSESELAAYSRGELPEAAAESLQAHLGVCRRCTSAVLAAASGLADPDRLSDAEVADRVDEIVARGRPSQPVPRPRHKIGSGRIWQAVAALLAVTCLALAWTAAQLRRDVDRLESQRADAVPPGASAEIEQPYTGMPILDLYPSTVDRGGEHPTPFTLPEDAALVTLILTPPSGPAYRTYELRITSEDGVEVWRGAAEPNAAGAFIVVLPRRFLTADLDRIELYGTGGARDRLIERYAMPWATESG